MNEGATVLHRFYLRKWMIHRLKVVRKIKKLIPFQMRGTEIVILKLNNAEVELESKLKEMELMKRFYIWKNDDLKVLDCSRRLICHCLGAILLVLSSCLNIT